jgi:hypothetical protein
MWKVLIGSPTQNKSANFSLQKQARGGKCVIFFELGLAAASIITPPVSV